MCERRNAVCEEISAKGNFLLYMWMALIFLKTHLRDRKFKMERDLRAPAGTISDLYECEDLHHLHCVVRSVYTGARIMPGVTGSFLILPYLEEGSLEPFDYGDLYPAQCLFVRLDGLRSMRCLTTPAALCMV
jgi:hypothetical protein